MAKLKKVALNEELKDKSVSDYFFKGVADIIESDNQANRHRALSDLMHFLRDILGYAQVSEKPHKEVCDFLRNKWNFDVSENYPDEKHPKVITKYNKKKLKLVVLPRGHFKSTVITIGDNLRYITEDPNRRVLIASETFTNAKAYLAAIKSHIEGNEKYIRLFGNMVGSVWRDDAIRLPRTSPHKEETITCAGIGVTKVGMHYDRIVIDDPFSQENTQTREQIDKVINGFKLMFSILEPDGELIVVMTRWHDLDLVNHILEDRELKDQFDIMIRQCYVEDGEPYFPTRFPKESLENIRKSQGSYVFSAQYLNDPIDDSTAMFKKSYFRYWETLPPNLHRFTLVDPAISQSKGADFSAIITVGMSKNKDIYVMRAERDRFTPSQLVDKIFRAVEQDKPRLVGVELVAFQQILGFNIRQEMQKRNKYFSIKELKPGKRSKESRIGVYGLQPRFEAGKVYMRKEMTDLEDELLRFPKGAHDDLLDALAYSLDIASFPQKDWGKETQPTYRQSNPFTGY